MRGMGLSEDTSVLDTDFFAFVSVSNFFNRATCKTKLSSDEIVFVFRALCCVPSFFGLLHVADTVGGFV